MANNTSIPIQRQQRIAEYLNTTTTITIKEASMLSGVSEATARRDLDEMASSGLIERTHGGAILHRSTGFEEFHSEKMKVMIPEKTRIAKEAVCMISEGDCIFLDSGTTTYILSQQLVKIPKLTVITNNLDIAYSTKLDTSSTMIITGGVRRDGYSVLVGEIAEDLVRKLYVDISFIGADAINPQSGVFNSNFMEIGIKKSMIESANKKVLLADHSKFEQKALAKVCDLCAFDVIITDQGIDEQIAKKIKNKVQNLIIA